MPEERQERDQLTDPIRDALDESDRPGSFRNAVNRRLMVLNHRLAVREGTKSSWVASGGNCPPMFPPATDTSGMRGDSGAFGMPEHPPIGMPEEPETRRLVAPATRDGPLSQAEAGGAHVRNQSLAVAILEDPSLAPAQAAGGPRVEGRCVNRDAHCRHPLTGVLASRAASSHVPDGEQTT